MDRPSWGLTYFRRLHQLLGEATLILLTRGRCHINEPLIVPGSSPRHSGSSGQARSHPAGQAVPGGWAHEDRREDLALGGSGSQAD